MESSVAMFRLVVLGGVLLLGAGLPREYFPEPRDGKLPPPLGEDAKVSLDGGASLNVLFHMKE